MYSATRFRRKATSLFYRNSGDFGKAYSNFGKSTFGSAFKEGVAETFGWQFKKGKNQGFLGLKGGAEGRAGRLFQGGLSLAFVGYGAYQGYKEGGLWGATKSVASDAATWGLMKGVGVTLTSGPVLLAAATAAIGYGTYKVSQAAVQRGRGLRRLEFGGNIQDRFGTMATVRQRGLNAIQNSWLNGRNALGNEAMLYHSRYRV